jgi:hypothetical protein
MESETKNREDFRRYLLGELSDEECGEIESSLLDDGPYEELLATEQDMIDRYARGEMDLRERAAFEVHYVDSSPERLKRVAVASAVMNVLPKVAPQPFAKTKKAASTQYFINLIRDFFRRHRQHPVYAGIIITLLTSTVFLAYRAWVKPGDVAELGKTVEQLRAQLDEADTKSRRREEDVNKLREALVAQDDRLKSEISKLHQERDASLKRERELISELRSRDTGGTLAPQVISLLPYEGTAGTENHTLPTFPVRNKQVKLILRQRPGQARRLPSQYNISLNGRVVAEAVPLRHTRQGPIIELRIPSALLVEGINRITLNAADKYAAVGYVLSVRK